MLGAVRPLTGQIESYDAPATEEIARRVGLPVGEIVRFDGNTSPHALPSTRAEALTEELARIHTYPHGGYPRLERAIADYAGVAPANVLLGAGADDLILLLTRSFASPGDRVAIANDPTYPMFSIAVWVSGAEIGDDDPALTICCRPNNPTGELGELPAARHKKGLVLHGMGWPLSNDTGGGLFVYHWGENFCSIGFVVHLNANSFGVRLLRYTDADRRRQETIRMGPSESPRRSAQRSATAGANSTFSTCKSAAAATPSAAAAVHRGPPPS